MLNALRIAVIFFGGFIMGGGTLILLERARFYGRTSPELRPGVRAMYALCLANICVLSFVTVALVTHWNEEFSWRVPMAIAIFVTKGAFFLQLRAAGIEQERLLWHNRISHDEA